MTKNSYCNKGLQFFGPPCLHAFYDAWVWL